MQIKWLINPAVAGVAGVAVLLLLLVSLRCGWLAVAVSRFVRVATQQQRLQMHR
jgi:hypothetical protein